MRRADVGTWPGSARIMIDVLAVNADRSNARAPQIPMWCPCGRVHQQWWQNIKGGPPSCDAGKVLLANVKAAAEATAP